MEVTEFLREHWLSVLVASYLIGMALYGHYRGFLHLAVSMAALAASLLIVHFAMPHVTAFIKENTGIYEWVQESMGKAAGLEGLPDLPQMLPAQQRAMIEGAGLPETIKQALIENNNEEIYKMLGVRAFADYISAYLAEYAIRTGIFIVLFFAVYIMLRLLARALDLIARLPVLYGMNKIAGAVLGLCQAMVYLWLLCLALNLMVHTQWGRYLLNGIESEPWLSYLYHHNLLAKIATGMIGKLF